MKKYIIVIINNRSENSYISTSRDAKKHLRDYGGNKCIVQNMHGRNISAAENSAEFGIKSITI